MRPYSFHAHVYFDGSTSLEAVQLREELRRRFDVTLGRLHRTPVGPHPKPMFQVRFDLAAFSPIVPWLMLNRSGLDVLVHPETGDDLLDHTEHALWLGTPLSLNLAALVEEGATTAGQSAARSSATMKVR
ncbi:MAG: DOPA 4,5-dioxygenase family protein [Pseudomonadota bacterium]